MTIRVLLVDDHEIVRKGLRALLEKQPDMEVVGEARDAEEAVEAARHKAPDVVLMDLSMRGMNGLEATRRITGEEPRARVLCLSMHSESQFVTAALDAGASGYLLKDCALEELLRAIHAVVANGVYLSPAIAATVVEAFRRGRSEGEASPFDVLTARERAVLQLLAEGHSTKEIAGRLQVSVKTISTHREHIMQKLGIDNTAGLTKYAIRAGLTSSE